MPFVSPPRAIVREGAARRASDQPDHAALRRRSRLFTRPVFAEMARHGKFPGHLTGLIPLGLRELPADTRLADVFDHAYVELCTGYRNEYVYKNALASMIEPELERGGGSMHVEFRVSGSIVDVAIAGKTTTAFEIKTEYDSPRRLQTQTADYLKAFDEVYVVVAEQSIDRMLSSLDERVGMMLLDENGLTSIYRRAVPNAEAVDPISIFYCLRRAEYVEALEKIHGVSIEMPNGIISSHCRALFSELTPATAHRIFTEALRRRGSQQHHESYIAHLPRSLKALGYATPLSGAGRRRVLEALNKPVTTLLA